ncbi:hypothetical protein PIB30_029148 [Stylosanthes scabra]|uniref:Uncharacterized protein n=1 Tax=Stylosanthes scabra TaxID=79078 RepID=A0ABU6XBD5_9FABA|nr:hypothetical protein [Stylosanthes scabra]
MVADAFPQFETLEKNDEEEQHDPNPDAQRFYNLLEYVRKPLWEGSVFSQLSIATRMLAIKFENNYSQHALNKYRGWLERWPPMLAEFPPIDEDALWTRIAGGRKRGRIYGMDVVPSHKYPHLFVDPEDDDTTSGPPDLREQVTLLNKEIAQQAEAHAQSLAAVEAVCAEKTQSQEVSELRKAYSDMYSFLTQMRSSGSSSVAMPDLPPPPPPPPSPPPPPPPPARSQSPPPRPDQGTSSPQPEDDPDYV